MTYLDCCHGASLSRLNGVLKLDVGQLLLFFSLVVVSVLGRHVGELLCRECGQVITRQSELANATGVKEDFVKYSYNFPLVGKNIKVNVLKNPAGEHFHVFLLQKNRSPTIQRKGSSGR
ncbi:unnamed protein product [Caenorhabditis auriculariae]|uniref:CULT domain-containing protein n=1 Tax=Caenorhabditis auriculariae TaxID=2777116 RepID=A0A8S1GRE0_9PELO|nr:unnamed protein product [Caenorhabditis auriculariae]